MKNAFTFVIVSFVALIIGIILHFMGVRSAFEFIAVPAIVVLFVSLVAGASLPFQDLRCKMLLERLEVEYDDPRWYEDELKIKRIFVDLIGGEPELTRQTLKGSSIRTDETVDYHQTWSVNDVLRLLGRPPLDHETYGKYVPFIDTKFSKPHDAVHWTVTVTANKQGVEIFSDALHRHDISVSPCDER